MERIVDDLLVRPINVLAGTAYIGIAHVHGDCLDGLELLCGKLRKSGDSALRALAIGDRFNSAVVRIVDQRDVVALAERLLIDPGSGFRRLTRDLLFGDCQRDAMGVAKIAIREKASFQTSDHPRV